MTTQTLTQEHLTITEAEWELMRVLWAQEELTSRELINILLEATAWKEGTIKSLLSRLVDKGYIKKDTTHSPYLFRPLIGEREALRLKLDHLLASTCQRQVGQDLLYLVKNHPLSQGDIEALISVLNEKLTNAPETVPCTCQPGMCNCHKKGR